MVLVCEDGSDLMEAADFFKKKKGTCPLVVVGPGRAEGSTYWPASAWDAKRRRHCATAER